ncbi:BZIP domain-containing protein [Pleurotus pulmonarius]
MPTGLWACTLLVYNSMLSFKSESSADSASSLGSIPGTHQPELDYWERLIFSFDMDRDDPNKASRSARRGRSRGRSRSRSSTRGLPGSNVPDISDAALLAQFASAAAHQASSSQENPYDNFLQALQVSQGNPYAAYLHSSSGMPGQYYPPSGTGSIPYLPPQGVAWSQLPFQPPLPSPYNLPHNQSLPNFPPSFSSNYPVTTPFPQPHPDAAQGPAPSSSHSPLNSSPSPASPANEDAAAGAEDKRRRNTMASARFRIKKKQRTLNLQRSVSDLTGRAEELEKEAADLRRENTWLKEIVMLKGTRVAQMNAARRALAQGQPGQSDPSGSTPLLPASSKPETTDAGPQDKEDESDSDESDMGDDNDNAAQPSSKGKGKAKDS